MAMDDATGLVSELLGKLSELEQKVEHHRQDMASEFQRYSRQLLQNVPDDVSAKVAKAISDSLHNYPALHPALDHDNPVGNESQKSHIDHVDNPIPDLHSRSKRGKTSPPPLLPHTSGTPPETDNVPRSPHEREREFQGLFTPSYLPLLDSRDNRSSPASAPTPAPAPAPAPAPVLASPAALPSSSDHIQELTRDSAKDEQPAPSALNIQRPVPHRRLTEDTISSNTSDDSISKQRRRSALRRSSSSSIKLQSPRRVRFEVEGGEVLPTASPPSSPRIIEHTQSPLANTVNRMFPYQNMDAPEAADEETGLLGTSPPQPKKTSSTDRLKAMARSSDEDTSAWATVGNLQDMDEDEEVLVMGGRRSTNTAPRPKTNGTDEVQSSVLPESDTGTAEHVETVEAPAEMPEQDEDEDEDLLEMPALTSFKTKKRFSPPQPDVSDYSYNAAQNALTISNTVHNSAPSAARSSDSIPRPTSLDEDDELFDWDPDEAEDDGLAVQKKGGNLSQPRKYIDETDDENMEDEDAETSADQDLGGAGTLSSSIPITQPAPAVAPAPSKHAKEAVGSYNGRPFTISSVKDHSILEKAAKMGDVYSFVGSVDGRSGVDESTSYRPDAATFTGTPKSFSQRLMMEEFEDARRQSPGKGASSR